MYNTSYSIQILNMLRTFPPAVIFLLSLVLFPWFRDYFEICYSFYTIAKVWWKNTFGFHTIIWAEYKVYVFLWNFTRFYKTKVRLWLIFGIISLSVYELLAENKRFIVWVQYLVSRHTKKIGTDFGMFCPNRFGIRGR